MQASDIAEAMELGRLLFSGPCRFVHAAQRLEQVPSPGAPEIAFAGRSNVGKSSLINALTGQHMLARASNEPGRTRQLNFFNLGNRLTLVDMPGYGYARAPLSVTTDWQEAMFDFLRGRPTLRRVALLLDARIEIKAADRLVMDLLDRAAVTYQLVLTKVDALTPSNLSERLAEMNALTLAHAAAYPIVSSTSSRSGEGLASLRAEIAALLRAPR